MVQLKDKFWSITTKSAGKNAPAVIAVAQALLGSCFKCSRLINRIEKSASGAGASGERTYNDLAPAGPDIRLVHCFINTPTYYRGCRGASFCGIVRTRCSSMPRSSPFAIRLSSSEAAELNRRAAKYTLPYFQVQRAKMILLAAEGWNNDDIAKRLATRRDVVSVWRKRFFIERLVGLEERDRPGRPRTFPP
jgi:hypothetical protein